MAQYIAFDSKAEVAGAALLAMLDALKWNQTAALEILNKYNIVNLQADGWYPHQAALDTHREIAETIGVHNLYQIGTKIPENAIYPPDIDSLEKALATLDIAYHMNHRGGEVGHYELIKMESHQAIMLCHNPNPCDFDRGIIIATARRFATTGASVSLKHDESQGCRKLGGESCTYIVEWVLFKERKTTPFKTS